MTPFLLASGGERSVPRASALAGLRGRLFSTLGFTQDADLLFSGASP